MLQYADFVSETGADLTSSTVVTLNSTADTNYRTFAEAVTDSDLTDGNDVIVRLVQSGAQATWRATYSNTGGTLTKVAELQATGTLATGSGNTAVYITVDTATLQSAVLPIKSETITGTGITGAIGQMAVCDISGITTVDLAYTLPATGNVGDQCAVMMSTDAPATIGRELVIKANTGDTLIMGGESFAAAEATRLFIKGESLHFVVIAESAGVLTWALARGGDGRMACRYSLTLSADRPATNSAATDTDLQFNQASPSIGGLYSTSTYRFTARRKCDALVNLKWTPVNPVADQNYVQLNIKKNGAVESGAGVRQAATSGLMLALSVRTLPDLTNGDYLHFYYRTEEANIGCNASTSTGAGTYGYVEEILR